MVTPRRRKAASQLLDLSKATPRGMIRYPTGRDYFLGGGGGVFMRAAAAVFAFVCGRCCPIS